MHRTLKSELRAVASSQRASLIVTGVGRLTAVRDAIAELLREHGYSVVLDPSTAPDLVDLLTVVGDTAIDGALAGSVLGLVVGAIVGAPVDGAALGTGFGLILGGIRGAERVKQGWRLRATWDFDRGEPVLEVLPLLPGGSCAS